MIGEGKVDAVGDLDVLAILQGVIDTFDADFNMVTP